MERKQFEMISARYMEYLEEINDVKNRLFDMCGTIELKYFSEKSNELSNDSCNLFGKSTVEEHYDKIEEIKEKIIELDNLIEKDIKEIIYKDYLFIKNKR